ncbi:MAG: IclR family transcriptional regulator [Herbiconiux sp.]|uniref:IclR family transcriptional regulator n=1 Tax=Herbiconiux sp. TaxID=1871186 RepID=UPI00120D9406|nr:IclR family transcriptional regulator C-terminal domain-containing protein [Herbiconiux sp.]TAJ46920.1 MAG: IclR family transcriptional regulator [Herbiconiux sp.]
MLHEISRFARPAADTSEREQSEGGTVLTTLVRGLEVLQEVAADRGNATARSIGDDLGLKPGTIYHILRTLRATGHVVRLKGGRYDVGPNSLSLGRSLQQSTAVPPELEMLLARLHNKTHATAYLSGWHHGKILLKQSIEMEGSVRIDRLAVGYTYNMHARASCRSVLAFLAEADIEKMFRGVALSKLTPHTVNDYDDLLVELANTRNRGYALEMGEFQEGVGCISAPYFDSPMSPQGSFTISIDLSRLRQDQMPLIHAVRETAIMATNYYAKQRGSMLR